MTGIFECFLQSLWKKKWFHDERNFHLENNLVAFLSTVFPTVSGHPHFSSCPKAVNHFVRIDTRFYIKCMLFEHFIINTGFSSPFTPAKTTNSLHGIFHNTLKRHFRVHVIKTDKKFFSISLVDSCNLFIISTGLSDSNTSNKSFIL